MTNKVRRFTDAYGKIFKLIEEYNKEQDIWVRYINSSTEHEYTCRKEAFLSRFYPLPD